MTKTAKAKKVAPPRDEVEVIVCKESEDVYGWTVKEVAE